MSEKCLFCRIARGELPSRKAYEDDQFLAFHDINRRRRCIFW
jgi:histidine triad (HIT) family protein